MTYLPLLYDYVFPNYILPNALITELGIVNYIHSLNSNRLGPNSFFEQSIHSGSDGNNLLTFMFGNSLGSFPNSTGGTGSHLTSDMYQGIVKCLDESLYIGRQKWSKYIYPVRMSPHINDFCGAPSNNNSKLSGEYFWKHMSAQALEDARNGKAIIFLDFAQENFIEKESYDLLHDCIRRSNIFPNKIVLAFNSFNAQELYESWFSVENRFLEVRNWPFVLCNTSFYYKNNPESSISFELFTDLKTKIRDNYFLFKIRRPRPYRQAILFQLHEDNLLYKGDWSWLENRQYNEYDAKSIIQKYQLNIELSKIQEIFKMFPHALKDEPGGTFDTISSWTDRNSFPYQNAYFYICTETYAHGHYKSITEKICKPMVNFLPFIFFSFPGALQVLRDLGFKTFHPYINESYDLETDETLRFKLVYEEIKKLCNLSKEELHNWYYSLAETLIHNHQHVINFYQSDTYTLKLVEYLKERIS